MTTLIGIHKPRRNTAENHFLKKLQDSLAAWKKNKRNWWLKTFVYYYKLGHVSVFATYGVYVCLFVSSEQLTHSTKNDQGHNLNPSIINTM